VLNQTPGAVDLTADAQNPAEITARLQAVQSTSDSFLLLCSFPGEYVLFTLSVTSYQH
jgi:hypothetical protein